MNRQTVNRCAERGCPMLGYWREGEWCPQHRPEREQERALLDLPAPPNPEPGSTELGDTETGTGALTHAQRLARVDALVEQYQRKQAHR